MIKDSVYTNLLGHTFLLGILQFVTPSNQQAYCFEPNPHNSPTSSTTSECEQVLSFLHSWLGQQWQDSFLARTLSSLSDTPKPKPSPSFQPRPSSPTLPRETQPSFPSYRLERHPVSLGVLQLHPASTQSMACLLHPLSGLAIRLKWQSRARLSGLSCSPASTADCRQSTSLALRALSLSHSVRARAVPSHVQAHAPSPLRTRARARPRAKTLRCPPASTLFQPPKA
jgi:hypothetical protein